MKKLFSSVALLSILSVPLLSHADGVKYLGEIFNIAGTRCPNGSIEPEGQVLYKNVYPDLFNIIGYKYGGDGKNNFMLPNLADANSNKAVTTCMVISNANAILPW